MRVSIRNSQSTNLISLKLSILSSSLKTKQRESAGQLKEYSLRKKTHRRKRESRKKSLQRSKESIQSSSEKLSDSFLNL
jgi:hypothetical protein